MSENENNEKLKWRKVNTLGVSTIMKPLVGNLILLLEEEKKRTLKQIEDTQKMISKLKDMKR